jgi:cytochrome c oxidase assembly protein subunit 11
MAAYLAALTVAMVGATYASVPLYRMFCQATGAWRVRARGAAVKGVHTSMDDDDDGDVAVLCGH